MQDKIYSNFVTPPDFVDERKHTVLLVDVFDDQVQTLARFCKHTSVEFNVYLYNANMEDMNWFSQAVDRADAIIVNAVPNAFSALKELIAQSPKACYYGTERELKNSRRINNPIDYFIEYADTVK